MFRLALFASLALALAGCSSSGSCESGACVDSNTTSSSGGTSSSSTSSGGSGGSTGASSSSGSTGATGGSSGGTTGAPDVTPPACDSIAVSPASVDVSDGPAQATLTLHITDDASGFATGSVFLRYVDSEIEIDFDASMLSSGTVRDGVYTVPFAVQQYLLAGAYDTEVVQLYDAAGNLKQYVSATLTANLNVTLNVADTNPDTSPPVLESVSATPSSINLAQGPGTLTVTFQLRDDLSGFTSANTTLDVVFTDSAGDQLLGGYSASSRTSGTALDGIYTTTIGVPLSTPSGQYSLSRIDVEDAVGNSDTLQSGHWGTATNIPSVTVQ